MEAAWQNPDHTTLDKFAALKPSLKDLKDIACWIVKHYVADSRMEQLQNQPKVQWDQQYKDGLLLNKYCLLYEELCQAITLVILVVWKHV